MKRCETQRGNSDDHQHLQPGECGLKVGGLARADDVQRGDEPRCGDRENLGPEQMADGRMREKPER